MNIYEKLPIELKEEIDLRVWESNKKDIKEDLLNDLENIFLKKFLYLDIIIRSGSFGKARGKEMFNRTDNKREDGETYLFFKKNKYNIYNLLYNSY